MEQKELQILCEKISIDLFGEVFRHEVRFNNKLRTTGGRYLLKTHDIEINPKYLKEQGVDAVIEIIKHELCHYHLHIKGRGYKHGDRDFKCLMKKVGAPRFCKPLTTVKRVKQSYKYIYQCSTCKQEYKRKKRMDISRYACGKCRGELILKQEIKGS
ncbi:SprT family protein [Calidifontibacillus oryziterrae]|uniref:SprT family protein n=1 Tax=Calidifontibacillus oryziterrae TaxID=1191699 RepID=UPI00031B084B|nr:SprT family protein [Calidifontibacillus oryziterrae]